MGKEIEKAWPRVGIGLIVVRDGKVLLGKRKGNHGAGYWSTCGGHLEFGESVEACAMRELTEETGLKALSLTLGPWVNNIIGEKHYLTVFVFIDQFEGKPQNLEPDKCEGWVWMDWDNLPEPLFPSVRSLVDKMTLPRLKMRTYTQESLL